MNISINSDVPRRQRPGFLLPIVCHTQPMFNQLDSTVQRCRVLGEGRFIPGNLLVPRSPRTCTHILFEKTYRRPLDYNTKAVKSLSAGVCILMRGIETESAQYRYNIVCQTLNHVHVPFDTGIDPPPSFFCCSHGLLLACRR